LILQDIFAAAGDLTLESVTRASTACGPLYQWVHSQIDFSAIAQRVAPLREEVASLQQASDKVCTCDAPLHYKVELCRIVHMHILW
jgi:hypothetical protein